MLARNLPTQRFTIEELRELPQPYGVEWEYARCGHKHALHYDAEGKLIVIARNGSWPVRPIIRVRATNGK